MTLLKRVFAEHRVAAVALAILLVANAAVYAFIVYPLEARSTGAAERQSLSITALHQAERDHEAAAALVTGKARAEQELVTFYSKVIPPDFAAARRLTYARLPVLAREADVRYESAAFEIDPALKNGRLGRLRVRMALQGDYAGFRRFIYALETAPDFIVIDDVTIAQGGDPERPLSVTLQLSTYYLTGINGT
jgi:hypothetical protein